jgi:hypothetical protein
MRGQRTYFAVNDTGALAHVLGDFVEQTGSEQGIVAFGPRAYRAVAGDRLYFAPGDVLEVRVHDPSGTLLRISRLDRAPRAVTEADRSAYTDSMDASMRGLPPESAARQRARIGDPQFHPHFPALGAILVDATGATWLADYTPPFHSPSNRWTVFDADGHYLGEVELPTGLTVDQIGADFVLGRWTDALDVEHVRLHALHKPGPAPQR